MLHSISSVNVILPILTLLKEEQLFMPKVEWGATEIRDQKMINNNHFEAVRGEIRNVKGKILSVPLSPSS